MKRQSKQALWAQRIQAFKASGQSRTAYCRQRGLAVQSFDYWRRRLSSAPSAAAEIPAFVPLQVQPTASAESLLLECTGGAVLRVPCGCDPTWLAAVLSGLR